MSDFETSEQTDKLDAALTKAQAEIQPAAKDKTNPAFRSKYADLPAVWDACREALNRNGINVTQWPVHGEDNRLHLVTRLACDGQWIRAHFSMPVTKQDPQGYGSAVTYAKRYTLAAAVGVVADEDDDGNHASQQPARQETPKASDKQVEFLGSLMRSHLFSDTEREKMRARIANRDRETVSAAITWAQDEMNARKEIEAQEAQPAGAA